MREFKIKINSIDERYTIIAECIRLGYTTDSSYFENLEDATWLLAYDDGLLADYTHTVKRGNYQIVTLEELRTMEKI